jgi:hypothetical protein
MRRCVNRNSWAIRTNTVSAIEHTNKKLIIITFAASKAVAIDWYDLSPHFTQNSVNEVKMNITFYTGCFE